MALAVWKGTVVAPRFHPIYATHGVNAGIPFPQNDLTVNSVR